MLLDLLALLPLKNLGLNALQVIRHHLKSNLPILVAYCSAAEHDHLMMRQLQVMHFCTKRPTSWAGHKHSICCVLQSLQDVTWRDVCNQNFPSYQYNPVGKHGWVKKIRALYFADEFDEVRATQCELL